MKRLLLCALSAFAFTSLNATTPSATVSSAAEHTVNITVNSEASCTVTPQAPTTFEYTKPLSGTIDPHYFGQTPYSLFKLSENCFQSLILDPSKTLVIEFDPWKESIREGSAATPDAGDGPDDMRIEYMLLLYTWGLFKNFKSFYLNDGLTPENRQFLVKFNGLGFHAQWADSFDYTNLNNYFLGITPTQVMNNLEFRARFFLNTFVAYSENNLAPSGQYVTDITANISIQ